MMSLRETIGEENKKCSIELNYFRNNSTLVKHILDNWDKLKIIFGNEFWERITRFGKKEAAWENLCVFADTYPSVRKEAIDYAKSLVDTNMPVTENVLSFIGRVCPRSELLAKCCLNILLPKDKRGQGLSYPQIYLAAKLLGEHFKGDKEIFAQLSQSVYHDDGIIQALCYGWADSEIVQKVFDSYKEDTRGWSYEVAVKLFSLKAARDRFFRTICGVIKDVEVDNSLLNIFGVRGISESIIYRLREDLSLSEMLIKKLSVNPTASEKATLPRLIYSAQGLSEELRKWSTDELAHQLSDDFFPETGVDLVAGKLMPVVHSLLAILKQ